MGIHRLSRPDFTSLEKPGKRSEQLVWPKNAPTAQVTITRVTMDPGALSDRHTHARSEQIWIVEQGQGSLLMAEGKAAPIRAGEIVITPPGEVHGVENTGTELFVYLAVTTPPQDFTPAYRVRG